MRRAEFALAAALAATLAGCSLAPAYAPPKVTVADAYKETGPWAPVAPVETAEGGAWWSMFSDPTLDDLQKRAAAASPRLASSVAAYDQARALAAQARAGLVPEVDAGALVNRTKRSADAPLRVGGPDQYDTRQIGASLAWEVDLWGRLRNQAAASGAKAEASAADLRGVRLSLQAELADDYLALRGLDAQAALLEDTVAAYAKALQLTQALHDGGAATGLDIGRAQTQLANAKAQLTDVGARRALLEHAIAALVGENASQFSLPPQVVALAQPVVPVGAPSVLLQRRPDVAAAERRAAAANAQIGVARAAWFPTLTLGASGGLQSSTVSLLSAPDAFWLVGPQLAGALFDGGRRNAGIRYARAGFDQAAADYRGVVLNAFRDVEDQLALCNRLALEAKDQDDAVAAAKRTEGLALARYKQGASAYLEVVTAQTAALDAERASIALNTRRLQASVDLTRALGGDLDKG